MELTPEDGAFGKWLDSQRDLAGVSPEAAWAEVGWNAALLHALSLAHAQKLGKPTIGMLKSLQTPYRAFR